MTRKLVSVDDATVANDDIAQRKAGSWVNRTMAQLRTDLGAITAASTDTLTNKTLVDASTTLQDDAAPTKQARFQASGITAGQTRIVTLPDKDGTMAMLSDISGSGIASTGVPIKFGASTAVIGVTPSDRAYVDRTLSGARMRVSTAPVGSSLIAQVQHSSDGSSYSTVGTLTITTGSTTEATASFSQAQSVGHLLRINVTAVGSTTPATGVAIDVTWT